MAGILIAAINNLKELWEVTALESGIQWQLLDVAPWGSTTDGVEWMRRFV